MIVSLGRWALVLSLLLSPDQPTPTRSSYLSASSEEAGMARPVSGGKIDAFFGPGDREGGGGVLPVALAVAFATAAVCYTLAAASRVRRLLGHRWVSRCGMKEIAELY